MLTIAWDIDDVLNNLMATWLEKWWKSKNKGCLLKYDDLIENPPNRLLKVTLEEYLQSLDAFRLSGRYEEMQPNPDVLQWFRSCGSNFKHMALTAVPRIAVSISAAWVFKHFGDWIRSFHFVPSARSGDIHTPYEKTKGGYLNWLKRVDIIIDDHPGNIQKASSLPVECHMPSHPWNSGGKTMAEILSALNSSC
jgi:hypothetical protein